jgi:hypothetical protein
VVRPLTAASARKPCTVGSSLRTGPSCGDRDCAAPVASAHSRVGRRWREAGSARSRGRWVVPDFRFETGALRSAGFFRTAVPPATGTRQSSRGGRTSRPIVDVFTFPNAGAGLASMKPLVEPMASIAARWAAEGDDPSFGGIRPFPVTIPCPSGTNRSQLSCLAERLAPSAGPWVLPRGTVAAHPVPRLTGLRLERLHQLGRDSSPGPFQVRRLVSGGLASVLRSGPPCSRRDSPAGSFWPLLGCSPVSDRKDAGESYC